MSDALYRIIDYPHSPVFDKAPKEVLAFTLRHVSGASWSIADGVLTASAGAVEHQYALADFTIAELCDALIADGFQVPYENPAINGRSARVLLRGANSQSSSNGDHVYAFESLLWCLYSAYGAELDDAEIGIAQAILQMHLGTVEGEWLDIWCDLYGIPRKSGESDASMRSRFPDEVFGARTNALAIEDRVQASTGKAIEIIEPWKRMFILDQSALSGSDHMEDADYWNFHVIQPISRVPVVFDDVVSSVRRNRPAGVVVYHPQVLMPVIHAIADDHDLFSGPPIRMRPGIAESDFVSTVYAARVDTDAGHWSAFAAFSSGDPAIISYHWSSERFYTSMSVYASRYWIGDWFGNGDWVKSTVFASKHTSLP